MPIKVMSVLLLGTGILNITSLVQAQSLVLPTQREQVDLLTSVHELFEQVKYSAKDEQATMDESMKLDMELMTKRAKLTVELMEELTLLKLSTGSNAVCALDAKEIIKNITQQSLGRLKEFTEKGLEDMLLNSQNLTIVTNSAVGHGEEFLDKLGSCSKKTGLAVISCYRKIIATDVLPVKGILSEAIRDHKEGHLKAFEIKAAANMYIDYMLDEIKNTLETALDSGLKCR